MGSENLTECPYCRELIKENALKCYHCQSWVRFSQVVEAPWCRPLQGRTVWGVCAGLAKKFGLSVMLVRLSFIVLFLFGGHGLLLYIILRLLMPDESEVGLATHPPV